MKRLRDDHDQLKSEYEKAHGLRAAFNADRKAYSDKIEAMEEQLS